MQVKPEVARDFDCARGFSGDESANEKIALVKKWAISRARYFLDQMEKAQGPFEIEGYLYTLKNLSSEAFIRVRSENLYGTPR